VSQAGVDRLHQSDLLEFFQFDLPYLPDADHCEQGDGDGGEVRCVGADRMRAGHSGAVTHVALSLTTSGLCPLHTHILTKFTQGGFPDTVITLSTVSQPAGVYNLAADQKLGEVSMRRKQACFLLNSQSVSQWVSERGEKERRERKREREREREREI
jgi:hypothetical protein